MKLMTAHLMCDGKNVLASRKRANGIHKALVTLPIENGLLEIVRLKAVARIVRNLSCRRGER